MKIAILGAGGLGKAAAHIISQKQSLHLTAVADVGGYVLNPGGIDADELQSVKVGGSVAHMNGGQRSTDAIGELIEARDQFDAVFIALPNLPNDFIPCVTQRFVAGGFQGAFVDALKRTRAMEMMFDLDELLKANNCTYLSGCGATPGLLTAAAAIAAQSFVRVEKVHIWWGVGIARWDDYRATIREDIAHLPGFDVDSAKVLTDGEVEQILNATYGKLTLTNMEHADDVMLERAGVCAREQVTVGGRDGHAKRGQAGFDDDDADRRDIRWPAFEPPIYFGRRNHDGGQRVRHGAGLFGARPLAARARHLRRVRLGRNDAADEQMNRA